MPTTAYHRNVSVTQAHTPRLTLLFPQFTGARIAQLQMRQQARGSEKLAYPDLVELPHPNKCQGPPQFALARGPLCPAHIGDCKANIPERFYTRAPPSQSETCHFHSVEEVRKQQCKPLPLEKGGNLGFWLLAAHCDLPGARCSYLGWQSKFKFCDQIGLTKNKTAMQLRVRTEGSLRRRQHKMCACCNASTYQHNAAAMKSHKQVAFMRR
jgi:hypothetical protein